MCIHCRNCDACAYSAHLFFVLLLSDISDSLPDMQATIRIISIVLAEFWGIIFQTTKTQGETSCKCSFGQIVFEEERDRDLFIEDAALYHTNQTWKIHFLLAKGNFLLGWLSAFASV